MLLSEGIAFSGDLFRTFIFLFLVLEELVASSTWNPLNSSSSSMQVEKVGINALFFVDWR